MEKKRHYWTREDFESLMDLVPAEQTEDLKLLCVPDHSPGSKDRSSSLCYPKSIKGASSELRLRGLDCNESVLQTLASEGAITIAQGAHPWTKEAIDAAAEWLYDNRHVTEWTAFCYVCNLRYGQCVRAHRVAAALYDLAFPLSFDPLGLVTLIEPAEGPDDYAFIRFYPKGHGAFSEGSSQGCEANRSD